MSDLNSSSIWESDVVASYENESSGGGGWIALTDVVLGYKVFARGMSNEETFFEYKIGDDDSKKQAHLKAKTFKDTYNSTVPEGEKKAGDPTNAIRIEVHKDAVYGKDTSTWSGNRIQDTPLWTPAFKEVIKPNLIESNTNEGRNQWCRISWTEDPHAKATGRTRVNPVTGEETTPLIMYIVESFLTKEDALDAAAEMDKDNTTSSAKPDKIEFGYDKEESEDIPDGWDKESWDLIVPEIKAMLEDGSASVKQIADDYGVPVKSVIDIKNKK